MKGVILYGPPAAGKDSITAALHEINSAYRLFPRIKVGSGRTSGYRMATTAEIEHLRERGEVVWENARYSSSYIIDRSFLIDHIGRSITVVHLGQVPAVSEVTRAVPEASWAVVYLWCPRDVAATRIRERNTDDDDERLRAWDATEPLQGADLFIDTSIMSIQQAASLIDGFWKGTPR
ncbi:hypothetical protein GCM10010168_15300 [Actinoplanes ianthinogenes]|uniref:Guanylate kinase n=1 Tax=Actinoplanes ianthinogenes TaxID=122358 RepID=A0ABM7LZE0_9ACTN|nr:kinase [Actinoplanes ianthinogenes]BCJ44717.1 hypothetical protein Aiant_53740 [Actinoplanes ianthinogenes]GGQ99561.1 hypothetical protein GCM10010168_15300 [Actinoplanes ianthinogenes]